MGKHDRTINNLCFVIINAAAHDIVTQYGQQSLIGAITWASVGVGVIARALNTFLIPYISYTVRVYFFFVLTVGGLAAMAFVNNFWVCLLFIACVGFASSFGESLFLGYLHQFDSTQLNAWSSGTGFAGVLGTALYIFYQSVGLELKYCWLVTIPFAFIYVIFFYLLRLPSTNKNTETERLLKYDGVKRTSSHFSSSSDISSSSNGSCGSELDASDLDSPSVESVEIYQSSKGSYTTMATTTGSTTTTKETSSQRLWRCIKLVAWPGLNLYLVYFFEYVIATGLADKSVHVYIDTLGDGSPDYNNPNYGMPDPAFYGEASHNWFYKNYFPVLNFMYWFGVFLSRSSLQIVEIRRIDILTLLQGFNFALWICIDRFKFVPLYWLFPLMFVVGLFGGASYVNVFNILANGGVVPAVDKELTINITATLITLGITSACIF
eukprot:Pgem_evm1s5252